MGFYQLGRVLVAEQKYPEARLALEKAVALRPDLSEAYYRLGSVYQRLGEGEKAKESLRIFERRQAVAMTERQEMLKAMGEVLQTESSQRAKLE